MGDTVQPVDEAKARQAYIWQALGNLAFGFDNGQSELVLSGSGGNVSLNARPALAVQRQQAANMVTIGGQQLPLVPLLVAGALVAWLFMRNKA